MNREHLLMWCRKKTNNPTLEDKEDFSLVLDNMIDIFERVGITSESIADLSQSFNTETQKDILSMLSPYRKAKFL